jgi:hypothetical protein
MKSPKVLASKESIEKTLKSLKTNGIEAYFAENAAEAKKKVLEFIPASSEVFTMTSITLETTGITKEINESGKYNSVRNSLNSMDQSKQGREMRKLGAAPDFSIGSAHALSETGTVITASLTGSQLPAYASGAGVHIWVIGAQKIVENVEEGLKRINEYVVPLESGRARKAYGLPESFSTFPSKILLFNREIQPGRVKLIIVNEVLGF